MVGHARRVWSSCVWCKQKTAYEISTRDWSSDVCSKQKTAYEISTRDWSSDVCSSDLATQTCPARRPRKAGGLSCADGARSEERRGGGEGRKWWGAEVFKQKKTKYK